MKKERGRRIKSLGCERTENRYKFKKMLENKIV